MAIAALRTTLIGCLLAATAACADESSAPRIDQDRLLIVGQDLDAIRGYMGSDCCSTPDGLTAYIDFYDILTPDDFGGLGLDGDARPIDLELDWQAGPVSAYKTATEFGVDGLAIGLSITENEHPGDLARLGAGEFDDEIRQLAKFFAMIEGPIWLRIGYEFDGAWNEGYGDAGEYKAAWRRIVDVLREEQATNVEFVWQGAASTVDEIIDGGPNDIRAWYPGDDYVDWLAFSWFMAPDEKPGVDGYVPRTPLELANEIIEFAREKSLPVMIAEASPQSFDLNRNTMANHAPIWDGPAGENIEAKTDDEIWDSWFAPLFELIDANDDVIRALAYINVHWDSQAMWGPPYESGYWGDTRLETNDTIATRFNAAIDAWRAKN
jgi:hypothetical protein